MRLLVKTHQLEETDRKTRCTTVQRRRRDDDDYVMHTHGSQERKKHTSCGGRREDSFNIAINGRREDSLNIFRNIKSLCKWITFMLLLLFFLLVVKLLLLYWQEVVRRNAVPTQREVIARREKLWPR